MCVLTSVPVCAHSLSHVPLIVTAWTIACQAPPDKNTRVVCHFLLQGIFPMQGLNPSLLCLLHWHMDSLPLSHLGNPYKAFSRMVITGLILLWAVGQRFLTCFRPLSPEPSFSKECCLDAQTEPGHDRQMILVLLPAPHPLWERNPPCYWSSSRLWSIMLLSVFGR